MKINPMQVNFEKSFHRFVAELNLELIESNVDTLGLFPDHICFRVETINEYVEYNFFELNSPSYS